MMSVQRDSVDGTDTPRDSIAISEESGVPLAPPKAGRLALLSSRAKIGLAIATVVGLGMVGSTIYAVNTGCSDATATLGACVQASAAKAMSFHPTSSHHSAGLQEAHSEKDGIRWGWSDFSAVRVQASPACQFGWCNCKQIQTGERTTAGAMLIAERYAFMPKALVSKVVRLLPAFSICIDSPASQMVARIANQRKTKTVMIHVKKPVRRTWRTAPAAGE